MKLITLARQYNFICYWCHKKFELEDLSRDHIVPQSYKLKGHGRGKCVLACIFCNQERGNKSFDFFKGEKQNLPYKIDKNINYLLEVELLCQKPKRSTTK